MFVTLGWRILCLLQAKHTHMNETNRARTLKVLEHGWLDLNLYKAKVVFAGCIEMEKGGEFVVTWVGVLAQQSCMCIWWRQFTAFPWAKFTLNTKGIIFNVWKYLNQQLTDHSAATIPVLLIMCFQCSYLQCIMSLIRPQFQCFMWCNVSLCFGVACFNVVCINTQIVKDAACFWQSFLPVRKPMSWTSYKGSVDGVFSCVRVCVSVNLRPLNLWIVLVCFVPYRPVLVSVMWPLSTHHHMLSSKGENAMVL